MHPVSKQIIGQILAPQGGPAAEASAASPTTMTMQQIVQPRPASGAYTGPDRRAQGFLVAEIVAPAAPAAEPPAREP